MQVADCVAVELAVTDADAVPVALCAGEPESDGTTVTDALCAGEPESDGRTVPVGVEKRERVESRVDTAV